MTEEEFIRWVRSQCAKLNVKVRIGKGKTVNNLGTPCDGYFQEPDKYGPGELAVAKHCDNFILCLAHEYTHMLQWFYDEPIYTLRESDYYTLEKTTEREALKLLRKLNVNTRLRESARRSSKEYLKWLKKETR